LTNVARHARASCADVDVTGTPDRLIITITDDGIGIDRAPVRSGIAAMRRYAVDHDGAFSVMPRKPSGTQLIWTVPIR
jgi:signal transduction histidine kinase